MNAAMLDLALDILYRAVWRLKMSRTKPMPVPDIVAIGILEDAAKRVLKGDTQ